MALFKNVVHTNSYDIIAVTETWLTDNISDSELLEYGYTIYRRDRQVKIEGGVLLAVKSNISSNRRFDHDGSDLETACIELSRPDSTKLLVTVTYRPPNADLEFLNSFTVLLKEFTTNPSYQMSDSRRL